ncbi:MAG: redoxin domain-containing protein [Saprospiraceae bacterium]|nr:redoxin domain-containing protein [Saprospiraceae bacterium]MCB9320570.1 redoxin domain-containing protein [Lewinellaceae bacterium]
MFLKWVSYALTGVAVFSLAACQYTSPHHTVSPFYKHALTLDDIPKSDFAGLNTMLEHGKDTTYILNFWATWCHPCIEEMPYFEALYPQLLDKPVKIVLVSLDFPEQADEKLPAFIQRHQVHNQVWFLDDPNPNQWVNALETEWSGSIPATLIWKGGKQAFKEGMFANPEELKSFIQPYI